MDIPGFKLVFEIAALFDTLREKVGQQSRGGVPIHDFHDLKRISRRDGIRIAVIAVPSPAAQHVLNQVVAAKSDFAGVADIVTVRAVKTDVELFKTARLLLKDGGRLLLFRPSHSATADPDGFRRILTAPLCYSPQSFVCVYQRMFHVEQ